MLLITSLVSVAGLVYTIFFRNILASLLKRLFSTVYLLKLSSDINHRTFYILHRNCYTWTFDISKKQHRIVSFTIVSCSNCIPKFEYNITIVIRTVKVS